MGDVHNRLHFDRQIRRHNSQFIYMTDNNDNPVFFIPKPFPPDCSRRTDLAVICTFPDRFEDMRISAYTPNQIMKRGVEP